MFAFGKWKRKAPKKDKSCGSDPEPQARRSSSSSSGSRTKMDKFAFEYIERDIGDRDKDLEPTLTFQVMEDTYRHVTFSVIGTDIEASKRALSLFLDYTGDASLDRAPGICYPETTQPGEKDTVCTVWKMDPEENVMSEVGKIVVVEHKDSMDSWRICPPFSLKSKEALVLVFSGQDVIVEKSQSGSFCSGESAASPPDPSSSRDSGANSAG